MKRRREWCRGGERGVEEDKGEGEGTGEGEGDRGGERGIEERGVGGGERGWRRRRGLWPIPGGDGEGDLRGEMQR